MKVGDLVCDPDIVKKGIVDRCTGLIIARDDCGTNYPKSYCSCGKNKYVVWWPNANITYEQCECELEIT